VANGLPAVDIDPHWVERALDELADNAVKYTPAGSTITLAAASSDDGRHVRVSLRDAGPGFDPQRAAELASDFSQADASETRRVGGMGLGLGFVSRVADRFDLHLSIDSEPGNGAEFALLLPVLQDDARDGTDGAGSEVQGPAGGRDGRGALRRTTTTRARAARKTASRSDR
jgi:signal transduction histidine kinase